MKNRPRLSLHSRFGGLLRAIRSSMAILVCAHGTAILTMIAVQWVTFEGENFRESRENALQVGTRSIIKVLKCVGVLANKRRFAHAQSIKLPSAVNVEVGRESFLSNH